MLITIVLDASLYAGRTEPFLHVSRHGGWQAQRSLNAAAVVHGLRAWRLLLLPSSIGERAPALSPLVVYQLLFSALAV